MIAELLTELREARARTRLVADDLDGEREFGPMLAIVNREAVLERVSSRIGECDPYFVQLAVRHEDMHAEAFHYTRQTLGYPPPAVASTPSVVSSAGGDSSHPGGVFRLGAERNG